MGCDIHIVLEKKHEGAWVGLHEMSFTTAKLNGVKERYVGYALRERDYNFFYALAGVRGGIGEPGTPKGLPDDISTSRR